MARRKKTSTFDDLIFIASRLPWWLSLLIAFVAWIFLHPIAISSPPTIANPNQMGQAMAGQAWRTMAMFLQYLIPLAFVLGTIGSLVGGAKRKKLITDVAAATKPGKTVEGISWREFEHLVGEVYRRKGFTVIETGGSGTDGGIDLVLHMGSDKYLVQCKQWKSIKVGVTVIREFFGVMAAEGAAGGFVVTSGTYTQEAQAFAQGRNIQLVDGTLLKHWIATHHTAPLKSQFLKPESQVDMSKEVSTPLCPVCSSPMQMKMAKRGINAGGDFWGCPKFPGCRGTRTV